ncbi:hypothetical protein [Cytophaga sp. FL35]|uniref:hypothetical protein n=1 Tax=Cytophaga sp. FL35 TaxID=1904456 RepID=UPI001653CE86|nr:hypothetical protein [Cytophaga sp. FL35]MBC7000737.1 hypothetical protein [Cytophaga sp. FL35]
MSNKYLIELIRNYQDDYYSRHKAAEIFEEITSLKDDLKFPKKKLAREFGNGYEMLGQVHKIPDIEEFASTFALALMKIVMALKRSQRSLGPL